MLGTIPPGACHLKTASTESCQWEVLMCLFLSVGCFFALCDPDALGCIYSAVQLKHLSQ